MSGLHVDRVLGRAEAPSKIRLGNLKLRKNQEGAQLRRAQVNVLMIDQATIAKMEDLLHVKRAF